MIKKIEYKLKSYKETFFIIIVFLNIIHNFSIYKYINNFENIFAKNLETLFIHSFINLLYYNIENISKE